MLIELNYLSVSIKVHSPSFRPHKSPTKLRFLEVFLVKVTPHIRKPVLVSPRIQTPNRQMNHLGYKWCEAKIIYFAAIIYLTAVISHMRHSIRYVIVLPWQGEFDLDYSMLREHPPASGHDAG